MMIASLPFHQLTNNYRKSRRKHGPEMRLKTDVILGHQNYTRANTLTPCSGTRHHKHGQIRFGPGKGFYPPDPSQGWSTHFSKQFHLPEAHTQFIEQTLDKWLKMGVVRRSNSPYNSPIFCIPKKQGQGLRIVQDFWQLNQHSHIDKYSMKEFNECIGDIGTANSSIISTLDLTSRFWQMELEPDSQPLTAFTIPNRGQFH